ncbi:hypothetical protein GKE82_25590 [Conexibacter sp. W3-3-2]|uniref:hypothetical protein n=1 Tax=Conexibacter sp. W3-3-2 TaxID=2675227 RepID=UPI0012B76513|nr:hypothetical protein [Conexibacter sp. W3-3-2]MTD47442.1 hypothetical protein [Conexibacter sp. W3-3-2]MTD47581.1 hypothetical protein [Conexibacter sp. W3-3-2]
MAATQANASPKWECGQGAGVTSFARSPEARVYLRSRSGVLGNEPKSVVGCWRPTGKRTRIGFNDNGFDFERDRVRHVILSGRFVAYTQRHADGNNPGAGTERALGVDLETGKLVACGNAESSIDEVALTSRGAIAVLSSNRSLLQVFDVRGATTLVRRATSPISRLRVNGDRIVWRRGDRTGAARAMPASPVTAACEGVQIRPF